MKSNRAFAAFVFALRAAYESSFAEHAGDGRFELYKTTAEHDGEVGRQQHRFPSQDEVAL